MTSNIYAQARADMLWERMLTIYGKEARNKFDEESRKNWASILGDMTQDQFRNGLARLNFTQRCPSVSQFLRLCREVGQDAAMLTPVATALPKDDEDTDRWEDAWQYRLRKFSAEHGMGGMGLKCFGPATHVHLPADWKPHPCDAEIVQVRLWHARSWAIRCREAFEIHIDTDTGETVRATMDEKHPDVRKWLDSWWKEAMERANLECRAIWAKYISLEAGDDKPEL